MNMFSYQTRLAETISWCSSRPLKTQPEESDEVNAARGSIERAIQLKREIFQSAGGYEEAIRTPTWREAEELHKLGTIAYQAPALYGQLRSEFLKPSAYPLSRQAPTRRTEIVEELAQRRTTFLLSAGAGPASPQTNVGKGRILLYAPSDTVVDGASEYWSLHFFDIEDEPPWDTWLCYLHPNLVCWVPPLLEGLAQAGIDVNAVDCIQWAGPEFVQSLENQSGG
jgi:hypothetical protein